MSAAKKLRPPLSHLTLDMEEMEVLYRACLGYEMEHPEGEELEELRRVIKRLEKHRAPNWREWKLGK